MGRGAAGDRRRRSAPGLAVLAAGFVAVGVALAAEVADLLATPEQDTVALRFQLRGPQPVDDVAVVAIDDVTFSDLRRQWPFPRSLHGRAIDALRAAGARQVVYDVQFTEPTRAREDAALFAAVRRAPRTVLATTETDGEGGHRILGGSDNLRAARAHAGAANLVTEGGGVIQRFSHSVGGLRTLGVVSAAHAGGPSLAPGAFPPGGAWIDFRGPPETIPTVSFSDLIRGRADTDLLRGRIVVVGASAATLQDVHPTPASTGQLMSGPEVQANTIWTALHGLPLRSAPAWAGWLAILLAGFAPALATVRGRAARAALVAPVLAVAWLAGAQAAFAAGVILPVSYPLVALLLGTGGAMTSAFVLERAERRRAGLYAEQLEHEVSARTEQLRQTQLEIVSRLGRAVESRDAETGIHVDRMSTLSERLALAIGMPPAEAETLRHAAMLHDVGKVGVPDRVLQKPGRLDAGERAQMEAHTSIGADILDGSPSELIQLGAVIARSHHERWDGSGYPLGLRGEAIPLAARICAVCDVFDALRSERPYKPAWAVEAALAELTAQRGRYFDPALVDAFLALVPHLDAAALATGSPRPARTTGASRPGVGELGVATVGPAAAETPTGVPPGGGRRAERTERAPRGTARG